MSVFFNVLKYAVVSVKGEIVWLLELLAFSLNSCKTSTTSCINVTCELRRRPTRASFLSRVWYCGHDFAQVCHRGRRIAPWTGALLQSPAILSPTTGQHT